jgi:predicted HAD superfamily Cof-like phosphohydrolase
MDARVTTADFACPVPFRSAAFRRFMADVRAFHVVCALPIASSPAKLDPERVALRERLLIEEWDETKAALAAKDITEVADGLVDVIYIAAGTAIECGIDLAQQDAYAFGNEFDPYVADLRKALFEREPTVRIAAKGDLVEIMDGLVAAANRSIAADDHGRMSMVLSRVIEVALFIGAVCSVPVFEVWREIHRSNMSKADPVTGFVRKREDGKVLKPEGWKRPDVIGVMDMYRKNLSETAVLKESADALDAAYREAQKATPFILNGDPAGVEKRIEVAIRRYLEVMSLTVFCYEEFVRDDGRVGELLSAMDETVSWAKSAEEASATNYEASAGSYAYSVMSASIKSLLKLRALQAEMQKD